MREIKFRQAIFYNGIFNHWHYWGFCGYHDEYVAPLLGVSPTTGYEIKESQAFINLPDKQGKEIYEGDIVRIAGNFKGKVFDRLGCWFVEMGRELGYYPTDDREVIGNIYEHSYLLDTKTEM